MAETVIFPLSEETGRQILAALRRIATALENGSGGGDTPGGDEPGGDTPGGDEPGGDTPGGDEPGGDASVSASVSGRTLTLTGTGVSVSDGRITIDGASADGRSLTIG